MIPVGGDRFERTVRQVLTGADVGIRHQDNVGPVVTFRYLAARAPIDVLVGTREPPFEIRVARATNRTDGVIESGCRASWTWRRGSIRIEALDVSDTTAEYDVTLWLTMG